MTDELVHPAVGHLIVLRSTLAAALTNVDAAIALLAGSVVPEGSDTAADCQHPEDQLEKLNSGLGEPLRVRCRVCGEEFEKEAAW